MLDDRTRIVLQQTARRFSRSLLQYAQDALPWANNSDKPALELLNKLATEEREALSKLFLFLHKHHAIPGYIGAFPSSFTTLNFVTVEYLRPLIAQQSKAEIARLEADVAQVTDPDARSLLKDLLGIKKRQLSELENFKSQATVHAPAIAPAH
jgi:hypothetical protein